MYANVNDFRENNFFPVFDCILENSLKNIFHRKIFANVNDFRENNFFLVFDCILENSLKNIFQCLGQRKMKKKKKSETIANANPPP